ncbi:MAG: DUF4129 domain-containing protein [Anaerolineae bacterium]|nr:DUF4129 domain-containing protein [Anaerolineae bacterium]
MVRNRLWALAFLAAAVVATILLAAGLSDFTLRVGRSLPVATETEPLLPGSGIPPGSTLFEKLFVALLLMVQLLIPFAIVYVILSPQARKQVIKSLGVLMWLIAIYVILSRQHHLRLPEAQLPQITLPTNSPGGESPLDIVVDPPQWLVIASAAGLALLVSAAVVGFGQLLLRRRRFASPLEQLAGEAQDALEALQAGENLRDVVLRCYYEMLRISSEQRGLQREKTTTPREFERYLVEAGMPGEQVQQLTRLFESVRYGAKTPDKLQEQQAVTCLTAIVEACRSPS